MDYTTPGLPVLHHLPKFAQVHVHCISDAAQSSSNALFSCPQSFPASGTFPMSHLFTSDDQNTGASASASALTINIQCWFSLRLTGLISLLSKGVSQGSSLAHFFTCTTTIYSTTLFMTFYHLPVTVRALHKSPNCHYTLKNRLFAPYSPGLGTG